MDVRDGVGVAEVQQVGQLAVRREAPLLQQRAHGPVLHEEVVGDAQAGERVGQALRGVAQRASGGFDVDRFIHGRSFPVI